MAKGPVCKTGVSRVRSPPSTPYRVTMTRAHGFNVLRVELFLDFRQKKRFDEVEGAAVECGRAALAWAQAVAASGRHLVPGEAAEWIASRPEAAVLMPVSVDGVVRWFSEADAPKRVRLGRNMIVPVMIDPSEVIFSSDGRSVRLPYFPDPVRFKQNKRLTYDPESVTAPSDGKLRKNSLIRSMWLQTENNKRTLFVDCTPPAPPVLQDAQSLTRVSRSRVRV